MAMLAVKSLDFSYSGKPVLSGLSFSVNEGDFVGVIGPNGAGKTTLFKVLTRVLKPTGGSVFYRGHDIFRYRGFEKEAAAMSQFTDEPFSFYVEDFVMMGRFPHIGRFGEPGRRDREIAGECMQITGTYPLMKRKVNELSGGEKQRVCLAQVLAQEPKLLFLDEPTSHLDIGHQVEVMDLIQKLNAEKRITVLAVLHDLNLASEYCSRLILMDNGAVKTQGSPSEVLTYQNIEEVYKTVVIAKNNPITGKPHIFAVSQNNLKIPGNISGT